jgi:hypothetical protein
MEKPKSTFNQRPVDKAKFNVAAYHARSSGGDNVEFRTCETCNARDAWPFFTTTLKEVSRKNRQPRWFCSKHEPRKVVSPTDGSVQTLREYRRLHPR